MSLDKLRRSIRHLLNERDPADALASYYAYYHADTQTHIELHEMQTGQVTGYLAVSRTGMDLFKPLVTLRLPLDDLNAGLELVTKALPEGSANIIYAPSSYRPLLKALFDFETDELYRLLVLDKSRFEPIINILVTHTSSPDGLPRFVIRSQQDPVQVMAAAGLNWQTRYFAEISVQTSPGVRRQGWGQSVVAAMVHHQLQNGRIPLYVTAERNLAAIQLAQSVGFVDSGERIIFAHTIRKNPF